MGPARVRQGAFDEWNRFWIINLSKEASQYATSFNGLPLSSTSPARAVANEEAPGGIGLRNHAHASLRITRPVESNLQTHRSCKPPLASVARGSTGRSSMSVSFVKNDGRDGLVSVRAVHRVSFHRVF